VVSEAARYRAVHQLAVSFSKLAGARLGRKWHADFEAWLFARRQDCDSGDALLPTAHEGVLTRADLALRRRLVELGEDAETAAAICLDLSRLPQRLLSRVSFMGWG